MNKSNKTNKVKNDLKKEFGDKLIDVKTSRTFLAKVEEDAKKDLHQLVFDDEDNNDFERNIFLNL